MLYVWQTDFLKKVSIIDGFQGYSDAAWTFPSRTHGFTNGYIPIENKDILSGYSDGWLAGRHAFLTGSSNNINRSSHTQNYKAGFNGGYHADKDPYAVDLAYRLHSITWTDCDDD
jgi:hypothetical protein